MLPFSAFRSIHHVQYEIETLFEILALIKQAGSFVSFHMVFSCFHGSVRSFVSDATCSPRVAERICVTSLGKPSFRSAVASFCVEMESVVKLLVLQCYGFTKSWIRLARFLSPMLKGECPTELPGRRQTSKWLEREDERESDFRTGDQFLTDGFQHAPGS